jgi:hypothetical protein
MNKGILTFVFALCLSLSTTQNVVAKEKKVTYMGHTYKGEVDNNKVPAGSGWIGIGRWWTDEGFTLFGDFKENQVENGSIDAGHVKFLGTFVFDESDCVTLMKGGTITYKIVSVNYRDEKVSERGESNVISSDLKVDMNYINGLRSCEASYTIAPEDIPSKLNPPTFTVKRNLSLGKYKYWSDVNSQYYDANAFLESSDKKNNHPNVYDYEDGEGRKWSYTVNKDYINSSSPVYDYTVTYPDGSYYSHKAEKYGVDWWKINYPNGDVFESTTNGEWIITLKNGIQICTGGPKSADEFVKYNNSKTYPTFGDSHNKVIIPTSLTDGLNSSQIANLIKEQILSVISLKRETTMISHVTRFENNRFREDETIIGRYSEGKYTSVKDVQAQKQTEQNAKNKVGQAQIAQFTKRFGFDPTKKTIKQLVTVGRSYQLLVDFFNFLNSDHDLIFHSGGNYLIELSTDRGNTKRYNLRHAEGYLGGNTYTNIKTLGFFWVRDGKVSSVTWF